MKLLKFNEVKQLQLPFSFLEVKDYLNDKIVIKTAQRIDGQTIIYSEQVGFTTIFEDNRDNLKTQKDLKKFVIKKLREQKSGEESVQNLPFDIAQEYFLNDEFIIFEMKDFENAIIPLMTSFDVLRRIIYEEQLAEKEKQSGLDTKILNEAITEIINDIKDEE